ncbi:hypothetical protein [Methylosinus sp. Sm6]|uniref:hypothetical protein n=1 Tax=Methylosinus sp. Sm6 TaxID=2866948 RepID=UPI001C98FA18|nr:hypothetical protein [Methylosinus sp. Sm6]MBY6239789.1 hypothetical protein [Methylosinus sp. Sm6]
MARDEWRDRPETAEARGLYVVRLHQSLDDWRTRRRLARMESWPPLARQMIDIEIAMLERELAECVGRWF